ncbi:Aminoglycoside phosphotransferase [Penicillium verhagenii]|uniref:Aminoglycoside phosphotransferase n=1 Tax=Penicillium verhagenii TaxID=1562060 RepID=UPI0025456D22|nr:Aminoglycoside phosphotransferase [Penicillium verhagenii]KAJ5927766.1 Aminoglycoside phosphotransferase [Penicillium verhagenii]
MSPNPKRDIFTYADFDLQAVCRQASILRGGVPCACDPDQRPASGSFNWAIFICFDDRVRWILRSPHPRTFMPMEMGMKLLVSEAATLRYLKAHSDIPVPEVYDYCASSDNAIGVPFIFMSEAPGWPLSKVWRPAGSSRPELDTLSKAKVLSQLSDITWKLSQLRFDTIGSLFEENESFEIKECLSRGHMLYGRYSLEIPRGPFTSESAVDLWNDFVTIGRKTDSSDNRLDYIIAGDALRDIVRKFDLPAINPETFPLCHADLSVNNIYVDDNYNITCVIDWAFASSIPEFMVLATPGLPQYRDEIDSELHVPFINGFIAAMPGSIEEKLIQKYRETLERGQVSWRFSRLLTFDTISDYKLTSLLLSGTLQMALKRTSGNILYHSGEDQPLSKIEKDEEEYFRKQCFRKTIAKKLTLVSGWKAQHTSDHPPKLRKDMFVASPQLWKWIQKFVNDWEDMS